MTNLNPRKAVRMIGGDDEMVELKSRCVALIFDCPRRMTSVKCPFEAIRKSDVVDRVNWIKAMTIQELRAILKRHSKCIHKGRQQPTTTETEAL